MRMFLLLVALATALIVGIIAFVFGFFDGFVANPVLRVGSVAISIFCGFFLVVLIDLLSIHIRERRIFR
ncbi:hypothetical protein HYW59_04330 [Candidatus Kaiserbacteria bacterium]|nr:hypothetical protein [Candidatus Kaiserbacteria bacterium]